VLAEVVFVLGSPRQYGIQRHQIAVTLAPYLAIRSLRVPDRAIHADALALYGATPDLDFEDALTVARFRSGQVDSVVSYDRDFDRFADIVRLEP
jgi:predicted nucleic acid-binding protein